MEVTTPMRIKQLAVGLCAAILLCGCSSESADTTSTVMDMPAVAVSDELQALLDSDSTNKFTYGGTKFGYELTTIIPDGYVVVPSIEESSRLVSLISDAKLYNLQGEYIQVTMLKATDDELGTMLHNPVQDYLCADADANLDTIMQVCPDPTISDVSLYITGDVTAAGIPCRNYINLSYANPAYPNIAIPEVNYLFALGNGNNLILRVAFNSERLPDLLLSAEQAVGGLVLTEDLDDLDGTFSQITYTLEEIAKTICEYTIIKVV